MSWLSRCRMSLYGGGRQQCSLCRAPRCCGTFGQHQHPARTVPQGFACRSDLLQGLFSAAASSWPTARLPRAQGALSSRRDAEGGAEGRAGGSQGCRQSQCWLPNPEQTLEAVGIFLHLLSNMFGLAVFERLPWTGVQEHVGKQRS